MVVVNVSRTFLFDCLSVVVVKVSRPYLSDRLSVMVVKVRPYLKASCHRALGAVKYIVPDHQP